MKFAKRVLIVCIICIAVVFAVMCLPIHGESEIYDSVLRLHVIANSDSEEDQALKLAVRDEVLEVAAEITEGCDSRDEAREALEARLGDIEAAARKRLCEEGYGYDVRVELGEEYYPTKEYESCSFPEGEYLSLRVIIGDGVGQNWWCCLFPPLCLSSASTVKNEDAFVSVGLTSEQYKIITETDKPRYKIRFKILEVFQRRGD